ncbi:MAG: hypothetical protein AB1758_12620, partial [Candidatus Eremiobacterota bacterium]
GFQLPVAEPVDGRATPASQPTATATPEAAVTPASEPTATPTPPRVSDPTSAAPFFLVLAGLGAVAGGLALFGLRPVPVIVSVTPGNDEQTFSVGPNRPLSLGGAQPPDGAGAGSNHLTSPYLPARVAVVTHAFPGRLMISGTGVKGVRTVLGDGTEVDSKPVRLMESATVHYTNPQGVVVALEVACGKGDRFQDGQTTEKEDDDLGWR